MPRRYNVILGPKSNKYYKIIRETSHVITRVITPYVITYWRYNAWDNVVYLKTTRFELTFAVSYDTKGTCNKRVASHPPLTHRCEVLNTPTKENTP